MYTEPSFLSFVVVIVPVHSAMIIVVGGAVVFGTRIETAGPRLVALALWHLRHGLRPSPVAHGVWAEEEREEEEEEEEDDDEDDEDEK